MNRKVSSPSFPPPRSSSTLNAGSSLGGPDRPRLRGHGPRGPFGRQTGKLKKDLSQLPRIFKQPFLLTCVMVLYQEVVDFLPAKSKLEEQPERSYNIHLVHDFGPEAHMGKLWWGIPPCMRLNHK